MRCDARSAARVHPAAVLLALIPLVVQGCAGRPSPLDRSALDRIGRGEELRSELDRRPYRADVPADLEGVAEARTAEDYVTLALSRNPAIRAGQAKVRRLSERAPQVRSLDDPMLMVTPIGDMAETAAGQVGVMTSLSQRLPLTSKLGTRGRIAELEASQAAADLEQVRLRVAGETRRAYWTYYFAFRALVTTEESRSLLVQFRDVADAQFRAGQRNQQDVLRASADLGNLSTELRVLAQRRDTASAMLRQLIDAPGSLPLAEPVPPGSGDFGVERDALLARAARANPGIRRVAERMAQFEQQQRLANQNRWPDLTVSLSYNVVNADGLSRVANGRDQWWVGFGINLPIWAEKYDAAEREAIFGRLEAASELASERNRVGFAVEDALLRLESQREVLRLLREQVIPDASGAVEAAAATYRTGAGDFLMLVDNWRKLLGYRVMEHQVVANAEQALADLQQAVGADIDRQTGNPRDDAQTESVPPTAPSGEESQR